MGEDITLAPCHIAVSEVVIETSTIDLRNHCGEQHLLVIVTDMGILISVGGLYELSGVDRDVIIVESTLNKVASEFMGSF